MFLVLLVGVHINTARILVKLALRDLAPPPAAAKPAVEDIEKACNIELHTQGAGFTVLPEPKLSSSMGFMDTAMSLTEEATFKKTLSSKL